MHESAPAITKGNPFGLPYWITDDERRISTEAAARLLTTESAIESIAQSRGWKLETIRNLALEPSLGITRDGRLAFLYESGLKVRWKENGERRFQWRFGKNWLWRGGYIRQSETIWVSEGEIDCITLVDHGFEDHGKTAVVALPGAAFTIDPWVSLFSEKRVVLCPDNDEAGSKCLDRMARALQGFASRIDYLDWSLVHA
jgi:Toprim-like